MEIKSPIPCRPRPRCLHSKCSFFLTPPLCHVYILHSKINLGQGWFTLFQFLAGSTDLAGQNYTWELGILCIHEKSGGLGLKKMVDQNIALLTKHAWQLATTDHKPHLQLHKSKYLEQQPFFSLSPKPRRSYFLRGLCKTRETVFEGATYRAEKGDKINVWHDPWISNIINSTPTAKILRTDRTDVSIAKVSELINSDYSWNAQMLEETFPTLVAHSITHPKRTGRRHTAYKC